jgi:hypothetical protein
MKFFLLIRLATALAFFSAGPVFLFLAACSGDLNSRLKEMEADSVRFSVQVRFSSSGDCEPDSQSCTFILHQYPMFIGLESGPLQTALERWRSDCFFGGKPDESGIDSMHHEFLESYHINNPQVTLERIDWREEHLGRVVSQNRQWICLEYFHRQFVRAAHHFRRTRILFLDKKTGMPLKAEDFFAPENLNILTRLAETEFRKRQNLDDTASLYRNGYAFGRDTFSIPANFWFTGNGIRLYFNPGELCAEEEGGFELQIPNSQILPLIRPGMLPGR